ncbi:hypothetical protein MMMB2_0485 [Mycobacterium marinum MB2]|nr:hypothetical protein MMMB2_0485 [Mycobacterium marinum MB2]
MECCSEPTGQPGNHHRPLPDGRSRRLSRSQQPNQAIPDRFGLTASPTA